MLNNIGLPGLLLIAVVVLVLFGRGKISSLMGEVGKGITAFKRGVKDGSEEVDSASAEATRDLPGTAADTMSGAATSGTMPGERARDVTPPASSQTTDRN